MAANKKRRSGGGFQHIFPPLHPVDELADLL